MIEIGPRPSPFDRVRTRPATRARATTSFMLPYLMAGCTFTTDSGGRRECSGASLSRLPIEWRSFSCVRPSHEVPRRLVHSVAVVECTNLGLALEDVPSLEKERHLFEFLGAGRCGVETRMAVRCPSLRPERRRGPVSSNTARYYAIHPLLLYTLGPSNTSYHVTSAVDRVARSMSSCTIVCGQVHRYPMPSGA